MGACTSKQPAVDRRAERMQERQTNMMQNMMQNVTQMQQQTLAHQQQMIRDDPDCKVLMDRQMEIQQKMLAAMQSGDQSALARAQSESIELQQNPKYMKLMMPQVPNLFKMGGTSGLPTKTQTSTFSAGGGAGMGANTMFNQQAFAFNTGTGMGANTPSNLQSTNGGFGAMGGGGGTAGSMFSDMGGMSSGGNDFGSGGDF